MLWIHFGLDHFARKQSLRFDTTKDTTVSYETLLAIDAMIIKCNTLNHKLGHASFSRESIMEQP